MLHNSSVGSPSKQYRLELSADMLKIAKAVRKGGCLLKASKPAKGCEFPRPIRATPFHTSCSLALGCSLATESCELVLDEIKGKREQMRTSECNPVVRV